MVFRFWRKGHSKNTVAFVAGEGTGLVERTAQDMDHLVKQTRAILTRWMELVTLGSEDEALKLLIPDTRPGSELERSGCKTWTGELLRQAIRSYGTFDELEADEQFQLCEAGSTMRETFAAGITIECAEYQMSGVQYLGEVMADLPRQDGDGCRLSDLTARFRFVAVSTEHMALLLDDIHVL